MNTLKWDAKGLQVRIERALEKLVEMKDPEYAHTISMGMVMTNINQNLNAPGPWTPIDISPEMKVEADKRRAAHPVAVS